MTSQDNNSPIRGSGHLRELLTPEGELLTPGEQLQVSYSLSGSTTPRRTPVYVLIGLHHTGDYYSSTTEEMVYGVYTTESAAREVGRVLVSTRRGVDDYLVREFILDSTEV